MNLTSEFAEALSAFQGQVTQPTKTKEAVVRHKDGNGQHKFKFADLPEVISAIREPLAENGLGYSQHPTLDGDRFILRTIVYHKSGGFMTSEYPLPGSAKPQEMGAAITYARRYALCAMLGIHADEDDDGAAAADVQAGPRTDAPVKTVEQLIEEVRGCKTIAQINGWTQRTRSVVGSFAEDDRARILEARGLHLQKLEDEQERTKLNQRGAELKKEIEGATTAMDLEDILAREDLWLNSLDDKHPKLAERLNEIIKARNEELDT